VDLRISSTIVQRHAENKFLHQLSIQRKIIRYILQPGHSVQAYEAGELLSIQNRENAFDGFVTRLAMGAGGTGALVMVNA